LGRDAGQSWFTAQLGTLPQLVGGITPTVQVTCGLQSNQIIAQVNYGGYIATHFFRLFPANWPGYPNWGIVGQTAAVISIPSYSEVDVLADNSSSMMIAASSGDIAKMDALTPCSEEAADEYNQDVNNNYSWSYTAVNGQNTSKFPASAISPQQAPGAAAIPANTTPLQQGSQLFLPYGYGTLIYPAATGGSIAQEFVTPTSSQIGQCDVNFSGSATECPYPQTFFSQNLLPGSGGGTVRVNASGQCTLNGQVYGGGKELQLAIAGAAPPASYKSSVNTPTAPCAFACHDSTDTNGNLQTYDYYYLATQNGVQLRYNVVQQAIAKTITTMQTSPAANQLSVGVYQFNAPGGVTCQNYGILQVYPQADTANLNGCNSAGIWDGNAWYTRPEAGTDFSNAVANASGIAPPITKDVPDTDFENAMTLLGNQLSAAGSGTLPTAPRKNLFIITDGMDDYNTANDPNNPNNAHADKGRVTWTMDPEVCTKFKTPVSEGGLGYTVYVLYIEYEPLPNPWYLYHGAKGVAESATPGGASPIAQALQACASGTASPYFIDVREGNLANIVSALNQMLLSAIGSAGRYSG
jgi:hypothetical protein